MSRWLTVLLSSMTIAVFAGPQAEASSRHGHMAAEGVGAVRLVAAGMVGYELFGAGTLVIQHQSQLRIHIQGRGDVYVTRDDQLVVTNFRGTVDVEGRRISAGYRAGEVKVAAVGHGHAVLRGRGTWRANGHHGHWSKRGTEVRW